MVEDIPPTYRDVLRDPEFRAVLLSDALSVVGDQVARIAVALLVFERTGSAFAASATYACSYLAWLAGGPVLSALADRRSRRGVMVSCDLARAGLVLVLLVPGLPLWALFAVLLLIGLLSPPFDAARSALLADLLEGDRYVAGNALMGTVGQLGQVAGFLAGGVLVAMLSVRGALVVDALTFALSALLFVVMVRDRPVIDPIRSTALSLRGELAAGVLLIQRDPTLRRLLGWGVLVAAMTIAPEGLAVPVADARGGGSVAVGVLTAAVPAGFVLGSWLVLRLPRERRMRSFPALTLLSGAALLVTPWLDPIWLLALVWAASGIGTALQLVANSAFVQAVPQHLRGRAFGAAGTALMAVQGIVLLLAGLLSDAVGPDATVAGLALAGLLVLAGLRVSRSPAASTAAPGPAGRPAAADADAAR